MGLNIHKLIGEKEQDAFGYAVAIGDVNGDKKNEVIVASTNGIKGGTITIYSEVLKPIKKIYIGKKKVNTIRLLISDVNKDNIGELIIAVTYQDLTGEVKIFSVKNNKFLHYWKSVKEFDAFGFSVAVGDLDGDGIPDIIVGAPQPIQNGRGRVYVYSGKDGSLLRQFSSMVPKEHSDYGTSVAAADVNGDGIDEVIIGAPGTPRGEVLIYSVNHGWLAHKITGDDPGFGIALHADDINGDQRKELIVTTKNLNGNKVSIYAGRRLNHLYDIENDEVDIGFGEVIATGDINGDGIKELIVGAFDSHHHKKKYTGQVNIYSGFDGSLIQRWYGNEEEDQFGFSLASGNMNGKKTDSILIGTPREMKAKKGNVFIATLKGD